MEQLINMTDAVFLGRVGEVELGASALACMYYLAIYMLGFGFGLGVQVMVARKNGEGRLQDTGRIFWQGQYFLIGLSATVCLLSELFSPILLRRIISSEAVRQAVTDYVSWRCYGLFFAFPVLVFRSFFVGITKTKVLIVNSILMVLANVVLNFLLIFGYGGLPAMGIAGAGLASSLAEGFSLLFFILYTGKKVDSIRYGLNAVYDFRLLWQLTKMSVWTMIRSFICVIPWLLFFVIIEHLGETQLAVANIIRNVFTIFFVILNSFATTTSALVSNLLGAGERQYILSLCRKVIRLSYLVGVPFVLLALLGANYILRIYTGDETLLREAFLPYIVMLSSYFLSVPGYTYCNAVIGTGHTRIAFLFQVMTILVYLVYLYILSSYPSLPLAIYWTADYLYALLLFAFSYHYMYTHEQFKARLVL